MEAQVRALAHLVGRPRYLAHCETACSHRPLARGLANLSGAVSASCVQRLLWDAGYRIGFSTPWVTQYRNVHNYLADFNSELPLYQQAGALVDALLAWSPESGSVPGRLEELYILMYEMGIVGSEDVRLAQSWLQDLVRLAYHFPPLGPPDQPPDQPPTSEDAPRT